MKRSLLFVILSLCISCVYASEVSDSVYMVTRNGKMTRVELLSKNSDTIVVSSNGIEYRITSKSATGIYSDDGTNLINPEFPVNTEVINKWATVESTNKETNLQKQDSPTQSNSNTNVVMASKGPKFSTTYMQELLMQDMEYREKLHSAMTTYFISSIATGVGATLLSYYPENPVPWAMLTAVNGITAVVSGIVMNVQISRINKNRINIDNQMRLFFSGNGVTIQF